MDLKQWYRLDNKTQLRKRPLYSNTFFPDELFHSHVIYSANGGPLVYHSNAHFHIYYLNGMKFNSFRWASPVSHYFFDKQDNLIVVSDQKVFKLNLFGYNVDTPVPLRFVYLANRSHF
jgi:hypothetical protein